MPIVALFRPAQWASGSSYRCNAVEEKGMRIDRYTKKTDRLELVWEGRKKFR
jgi:hypothetical protein